MKFRVKMRWWLLMAWLCVCVFSQQAAVPSTISCKIGIMLSIHLSSLACPALRSRSTFSPVYILYVVPSPTLCKPYARSGVRCYCKMWCNIYLGEGHWQANTSRHWHTFKLQPTISEQSSYLIDKHCSLDVWRRTEGGVHTAVCTMHWRKIDSKFIFRLENSRYSARSLARSIDLYQRSTFTLGAGHPSFISLINFWNTFLSLTFS